MKKTLDEVKLEIDPNEYYSPSQIAKHHWIVWFNGENAYYYILKLIQNKKLKAKNIGLGKTSYFRIMGSDLISFLESI